MSGLPVKADVKSDEDIEAMIYELGSDLSFLGFNPVKFRKDVAAKVDETEIIKIVTAYVQLGNNPNLAVNQRRTKRREDIAQLIKRVGERPARFAIAYMPLTLAIRKMLHAKKLLQNRFPNCGLDPVHQDSALAGWLGDKALNYLNLFDIALRNTGDRNNHGQERVAQFLNVAISGFLGDGPVHGVMKEELDIKAALAWLKADYAKAKNLK
jgi:hypothetical protein